jgi:hypothetical protein
MLLRLGSRLTLLLRCRKARARGIRLLHLQILQLRDGLFLMSAPVNFREWSSQRNVHAV